MCVSGVDNCTAAKGKDLNFFELLPNEVLYKIFNRNLLDSVSLTLASMTCKQFRAVIPSE
jgi:hypothetical protein